MQKQAIGSSAVNAYIEQYPLEVQQRLSRVRKVLLAAIPRAEEGIKYGMPTLMLQGKNVVHFAAMKNHLGLYPAPTAITAFQKDLLPFVTSKGAIQFPYDERLPLALIKRIAAYRAREVWQQLVKK